MYVCMWVCTYIRTPYLDYMCVYVRTRGILKLVIHTQKYPAAAFVEAI